MKNLSDIVPLYSVEQDMILSKRGDLTCCYQLTLPEIFTLSTHEYEALHQSWLKALKVLPAGTILHKQDWFTEENYNGDFEKEHSFLSRASERFFHERPFLDHRAYLMLTMPAKDYKPVNSLYSSLLRKHIVPVETLDPAHAKTFEANCSQFIRLLTDQGLINSRRLLGKELIDLVNSYLLLDSDGIRRDMDFSDGIRVGEKYCSLYSLGDAAELPAFCGPRIDHEKYGSEQSKFPVGFVAPLCQLLAVNHLYQQFISIEDAEQVVKELEQRKRRLQALSGYARENANTRDSVDRFLQEAIAEQRQLVRAHFHLLAWCKDPGKIQSLRNDCSAAISSIDAGAKLETMGAPQLYWAGIPGNAADLPVNETWLSFSSQACCFINQETQYSSSVSSFGIRLGDRLSGKPLQVDLSDEPMSRGIIANRNKFILGPSGSGKSFFTNHLIRSYYEQGAHIVMIDVGHSYQGLCSLVGGYYFSYGDKEPIRFNPFYLEEDAIPDTEKKESIKTLLVTLWKKENEIFSRSEYVALSSAIQAYYERKSTFRCFDDFYEYLRDEFSDRISKEQVKEKDFDLSNFLYVLRPYYKGGEFDYLLNARTNLDLLHKRFIVFELETIKDHPILFPVATIIIMEMFLAKIRKLKGVRKMILIEEAWKAIAKAGMAEYIRYLYKTIRKHFGEPIVVTQELDDILSSEIVKKTIISMSDCKILFDQSRYEQQFTQVQELLGLSEKDKTLVLSLNRANDPQRKYKEVFISLGNTVSKVYRVEVSPEEYLAYTTEEKEKLQVTRAAEQYGSMEAAIKSIIL